MLTSRQLMENVFEAMVRKFSTPRQINLLFVLRDWDERPLDALALKLREQLQKTWDGVAKPSNSTSSTLEDYFKIDVVTMSHYKHKKKDFDSEVIGLREKINSLVKPSGQLDSAIAFVALAESNWNDIKDDKILNISLNRIKIAGVVCYQILMKKIKKFTSGEPWIRIQKDVESGEVVRGFGDKVSTIISDHISEYDEETLSLDETQRLEHRDQLTELLLKEVTPAYLSLVSVTRDTIKSNYEKKIVENIIQGSRAFEKSELDKFISQYQTLMQDICIKQASWVQLDGEQSKRMTSELASIENGGRYIVTTLELLKSKKRMVTALTVTGTVLAAIGVAVCGAAGAVVVNGYLAASSAVETLGTVNAVVEALGMIAAEGGVVETVSGVVAIEGGAVTAFKNLMPIYGDYVKMKIEFKETCRGDPVIGALYFQYENKRS